MAPGPSTNAIFPQSDNSGSGSGSPPQHKTVAGGTWKPLTPYEIHLQRQVVTALRKKQSSVERKLSKEICVFKTTIKRLQGKITFLQKSIEQVDENIASTHGDTLTGLRAQHHKIGLITEHLRKVEYNMERSRKRKRDDN